MRRDILMGYSAPRIELYEVVTERGYGDSVVLPGFGAEDDELTY